MNTEEIQETQAERDERVRSEALADVGKMLDLIKYFRDGSHAVAMDNIIRIMTGAAGPEPEQLFHLDPAITPATEKGAQAGGGGR